MNGRDVLVQQIDLLERETLCLGNAEVGKDDTAGTGRTPDVKHIGAEVCVSGARVDQVGRCKIGSELLPETLRGDTRRDSLEYAMAQFQSQLDAVASDIALARTLRGKISPVITHAMGPHVAAKNEM